MEDAERRSATKFDLAERLVTRLAAAARPPRGGGRAAFPGAGDAAAALLAEVQGIRARSSMCVAALLFEAECGDPLEARGLLLDKMRGDGVFADLDAVAARALRLAGPAPPKKPRRGESAVVRVRRELAQIAERYNSYDCDGADAQYGERFVVCPDCSVEMLVHPELSELACPECGAVRPLVGAVFDDAQFYSQEGLRAKSGAYNPCRHFRFWMDHILAREADSEIGDKDDPDNIRGEKLIAKMRGMVTRDRKILQRLTVYDVREMLVELARTELNQNAALILRRLTGVGPPNVSEELYQKIEKDFIRIIAVDGDSRPAGNNRNHYPNAIYKLYDARLPAADHENRRVLYYIYLQSQDTLDKNEEEWEPIHEAFPDINWRPIIRTKALRYRPRG